MQPLVSAERRALRLRGPGQQDPAGIERDLAWLQGPDRMLLNEEDPRFPPQLAAEAAHEAMLRTRRQVSDGVEATLKRPNRRGGSKKR